MTLALLPEAVVSENGKELGRGSLVTLKLPAGTHLLSVVGPDGVKRTLSLKLKPGKNTALKLQVAELPAKP